MPSQEQIEEWRGELHSAEKMALGSVRRYLGAYREVLATTDPEELAIDVARDAIVKALEGLREFRGECAVSSWLIAIALNLARNAKQKFRTRDGGGRLYSFDSPPSQDEDDTGDDIRQIHEFADVRANPETAILSEELGTQVAQAVMGLKSEDREIIILREYMELSYTRIAEVLGISEQAVKSRLFRARQRVQVVLKSYLAP